MLTYLSFFLSKMEPNFFCLWTKTWINSFLNLHVVLTMWCYPITTFPTNEPFTSFRKPSTNVPFIKLGEDVVTRLFLVSISCLLEVCAISPLLIAWSIACMHHLVRVLIPCIFLMPHTLYPYAHLHVAICNHVNSTSHKHLLHYNYLTRWSSRRLMACYFFPVAT